MSALRSDAQTELENYVDGLVAAGYGLDAITDEIERLAALTDDEFAALPRDGAGRITMDSAPQTPGARSYFNIRDRAEGDATAARKLAEWAIRKLKHATMEIVDANQTAAERIADIERWRGDKVRCATRERSFFESVLSQYMDDFGGGERIVRLIGGNLKMTHHRDTPEWDEPAALAWAAKRKDADELAPRTLNRTNVKNALTKCNDGTYKTPDGKTVTFLKMVPPAQADTFSVELT